MKSLKFEKKILLIALLLSVNLLTGVMSSQTTCNAHIEMSSEDTQVSFDKMSLDIYSSSGSKSESSSCTPDGNCFIVVYNLDVFSVRMRGPQGSVFEPAEYKIDTKKGDSCDDLAFKLKGFSLKFAVKAQTQGDSLIAAPENVKLELRRAGKKNQAVLDTQVTDKNGNVVFSDITIPDTYQIKVISTEDITFKTDTVNCEFTWETGFKCQSEYFLITGFSITGHVLSYQDPMPNVKVYLHAHDSDIKEKNKNFL